LGINQHSKKYKHKEKDSFQETLNLLEKEHTILKESVIASGDIKKIEKYVEIIKKIDEHLNIILMYQQNLRKEIVNV